MSSRRRNPGPVRSEGPLSVQLPGPRRVLDLHTALAAFLDARPTLDPDRLEAALACAYDASTLGSGDCRAQATLVLLGFHEHRPAGLLDPPLAFLSVLALLDANGYALDDVPYAEIAAKLTDIANLRPEHGGAESLQQWLLECTKPAPPWTAPLPRLELARLVESNGLKLEVGEGQLRLLREMPAQGSSAWLPTAFRRRSWETVHALPDPGEGLIGVAAVRELRRACALEAVPFLDERAWQEGILRLHRHLWPRLLGAWPD